MRMMDIWREPSSHTESRPVVIIQQVIDAWNLSSELHQAAEQGASDAEIAEAEGLLGRAFPGDFRQLYRAFDGGAFVGGNIMLEPLMSANWPLTVVTNGDQLREWEWPIPEELVVFGGDGAGDLFGIWLPTQGKAKPVILTVGSIFTRASLAVVGDDFAGFLAGRSAYYLLLNAMDGFDSEAALDALGVPDKLRVAFSAEDSDYWNLLNWANPNLPDKAVDVYQNAWTAEQVAEFAALPD